MSAQQGKGTAEIRVIGRTAKGFPVLITGAVVMVTNKGGTFNETKTTQSDGRAIFELDKDDYFAHVDAFPAFSGRKSKQVPIPFCVLPGATNVVGCDINLGKDISLAISIDGAPETDLELSPVIPPGKNAILTARLLSDRVKGLLPDIEIRGARAQKILNAPPGTSAVLLQPDRGGEAFAFVSVGDKPGIYLDDASPTVSFPSFHPDLSILGSVRHQVAMKRSASLETRDLSFWPKIRKGTDALLFKHYFDFMEWLFCNDPPDPGNPIYRKPGLTGALKRTGKRMLPFTDTDAYRNVKAATEAFVMVNCGFAGDVNDFTWDDANFITDRVGIPLTPGDLWRLLGRYLDHEFIQNPGLLPYLAVIRRKMIDEPIKTVDIGDVEIDKKLDREQLIQAMNACHGLLRSRLTAPCFLELIWSYWQEEGMLVQTMNAIGRRFQNVRAPSGNDPLANLEVDPLRPLNNVLWGYIQDEQHRLSVVRRNYEYDHHYGLRLSGKAVNNVRTADSRSKFLEAFHTLLSVVSRFYRLDDDSTMNADAFPVLNALKEAHLILSQGAHNQYGDLPSTARIEMLMQQWILARPEFREFIPTRIMVAYPEPWMDRVDAMKKLQGWTDTSVLHFRNLAIFGEQVLLSIRFGNWNDVHDPYQALNWARYWRAEVQGYLHAYRSVTGVDLSVDVTNARIDATMPSMHLVKRLAEQQRIA